jgi:hypothetical protein
MSVSIDDEILKKTTHCRNNFACLTDEPLGVCGVVRDYHAGIIVTLCGKKGHCHYCICLNDKEGICTCPTRVELFRRYKG